MESGNIPTYVGVEATKSRANRALTLSTVAFTLNFACWMLYGVLITFLVLNRAYDWDNSQIGWLIGIPILTGAIFRLPVGLLTDIHGGRKMFTIVMLIAAIPMFLVSKADSFWGFFFAGLGFGLCGSTFAVGIAYTSVWFEKKWQGTALGILGAGNAGAAITSILAPILLNNFTDNGANIEGWRLLPQLYAAVLVLMAIIFWVGTFERKVKQEKTLSLQERLSPLKDVRVWRFGLYYFLVFGGFVALAQWLVPYYVNVYTLSVGTAGMLTAIFSFPSGVIRAFGGWFSDRAGARKVMYWVLGACLISSILLLPPRMEITSAGEGVLAQRAGTVIEVDEINYTITVLDPAGEETIYNYLGIEEGSSSLNEDDMAVIPTVDTWQEPVVEVNDEIERKQLLAKGISLITFQANIWIFTFFVFVLGMAMGIGKAAVYKHIPVYYPNDVGVVGGIVGVLGGLGGFILPVVFGYLLKWTGLWTMTWLLFAVITFACLIWMHLVIKRMTNRRAPEISRLIEDPGGSFLPSLNIHCPSTGTDSEIHLLFVPGNPPSMRVEKCATWGQENCPPECTMQCITEQIIDKK
ncbi:MAG: NarK/NasA family nitrate transporter [Euryarchaeota archaeon]|nr:NarK/NasA family nitrate transporter [Euryarchaeota archaeon]